MESAPSNWIFFFFWNKEAANFTSEQKTRPNDPPHKGPLDGLGAINHVPHAMQ